jgi:hypothetical protein
MVVDTPPNMIGKGAFSYLNNYFVNEKGLKKRPGISYSNYGVSIALAPPINFLTTLGTQAGDELTLLADSKYLYKVTTAGLVPIYDEYTTGTVTALTDGGTYTGVTGNATAWGGGGDYDLMPGDEMLIYNGATLVLSSTIQTVTDATHIRLTATGTTPVGPVSYTYIIRRLFVNPNNEYLDYCEAYVEGVNYILITDNNRYVRMTDGSTFTRFAPNYDFVCKFVAYFGDRVWLGHLIMDGSYWKDRYTWSRALNKQIFDAEALEDKPETVGTLVKLLPLGKKLVAYYEDAIFIGTPSNRSDLPYIFKRVESGGVGIAGIHCVTSTPLGHFFVGQSNVYVLTEDEQLYPLESGVMETYIPTCHYPAHTSVLCDAYNDQIVIGLPSDSSLDISRWFTYNWRLKAWSQFTYLAQSASLIKMASTVTYASMGAGDTYASFPLSVTYANIGRSSDLATIYFGVNESISYLTKDAAADNGTTAIVAQFATPSFDTDRPDERKTFTRLSIRLSEPSTIPLNFDISASIDEYNYLTGDGLLIPLGTLTIEAGRLEGFINFKMTASTLEFHATQTISDAPYHIREYVITILQRGVEKVQSILYGSL